MPRAHRRASFYGAVLSRTRHANLAYRESTSGELVLGVAHRPIGWVWQGRATDPKPYTALYYADSAFELPLLPNAAERWGMMCDLVRKAPAMCPGMSVFISVSPV